MKKCPSCGEEKSDDCFYESSTNVYCKLCARAKATARYRRSKGLPCPDEPKSAYPYPCPQCGKEVERGRYCSAACRTEASRNRAASRLAERPLSQLGLSTGQIGAVSELLVSADLLRRGFEVFRSVSQSASCDLIALKNKDALRVEVRTAAVQQSGRIFFATNPDGCERYDVLAAVTPAGLVHYVPEFEGDEPAPISDVVRGTILAAA